LRDSVVCAVITVHRGDHLHTQKTSEILHVEDRMIKLQAKQIVASLPTV